MSGRKRIPLIINIRKRVRRDGENLKLRGFCILKNLHALKSIDTDALSVNLSSGSSCDIKFKYRYGFPLPAGCRLNKYEITIPIKNILAADIQNALVVKYGDDIGRIMYSIFDFKAGTDRTSELFFAGGKTIYFRQTSKNTTCLTVRESNYLDTPEADAAVERAFREAKAGGGENIILMYEKECERYEESASVLYERLMDMGCDNVYFILDRDNEAWETAPRKYSKNFIEKHSYKHFLYFFMCDKFIGTETMGHAVQLRATNRKILRKLRSSNISYVFLQHGVMYMVALDAGIRGAFREHRQKIYRVVVSSKAEAEHFINLAGFRPEEIYITGLAKFDRSYRHENADKIVVMPTWRRWESNLAEKKFSDTGYYKMMCRIARAIPDEYRERLIVLPHPLMKKAMLREENELTKYFAPDKSYDEILRDCALLITDYSSIAYDAFYRGCNVIFYWEEKEHCLEQYGKAHLMIDNDSAFGDICYDGAELTNAVNDNYGRTQSEKHLEKYRRIVEFHDGKNTERIIECLKKDGIIDSV